MYKTILVHVDADDAASADRIALAAVLARDFQASLVGAAVRLSEATIEVLASGGAAVAGGVLAGQQDDGLTEAFAAARTVFQQATAGFAGDVSWRTIVDFPTLGLSRIAGVADLIVVGAEGQRHIGAGYTSVQVGELVMHTGRPVLVVPRGFDHLDVGGAVVAWRNTREARRAVADALPLLAIADPVTLLHVREADDDEASLADADRFLAGHGIAAATQVLDAGKGGAGAAIIDSAKRTQAGLLVAGAYGHSRAREWAFGGVTRDLTSSIPLPTLLSR